MFKKRLFAIFLLAFFLRLYAVSARGSSEKIQPPDAKGYDRIAVNIASGYGFSEILDGRRIPTARRTPVYPLFLAGIYAAFGHNYDAVKIIQAVLGALVCVPVFFIAYFMYGCKTGLIASFLTAIYKPFIWGINYYGGPAYLLSEDIYMFVLTLVILLLLFYLRKGTKSTGILLGVCVGLATLTRPEFIIFLILLSCYLFYNLQFSIKKFFRKYSIVYIFLALTLMPWVLRNYIVFGRFIPLSTLSGYVFWQGNNAQARGSWGYPKNYSEIMEKAANLPEYQQDLIYFKEGIKELKSDPGRIPKFFIRKVLVHWAPFEQGFKIFNPFYFFIFLLGSVGIVFFRQKIIMEKILSITFLTTTLMALVMYGDPRYRYPYEPFLIIFAALTINQSLFNENSPYKSKFIAC